MPSGDFNTGDRVVYVGKHHSTFNTKMIGMKGQ